MLGMCCIFNIGSRLLSERIYADSSRTWDNETEVSVVNALDSAADSNINKKLCYH